MCQDVIFDASLPGSAPVRYAGPPQALQLPALWLTPALILLIVALNGWIRRGFEDT